MKENKTIIIIIIIIIYGMGWLSFTWGGGLIGILHRLM